MAIKSFLLFSLTAVLEIAGCYAFWAWLRSGRSPLWLMPGVACLLAFAYLLTRVDVPLAGRAYAAYGGIYIAASLAWLFFVEGIAPDQWDYLGAVVCMIGAAIILFGPR